MTIDPEIVAHAAAVGIGATLLMDAWGLLAARAFGMPFPDYALVGRWLCGMPAGVFRHAGIARSPRRTGESWVGWLAHYATGIAYALLLVLIATPRWLDAPTPWPALALGIATVAAPFFVMQPAFGLGIAGARAPSPRQVRLRSVLNHTVFGLGLFVAAAVIARVLGGDG